MEHGNQSRSDLIHMPAPTAWPMVLALGVSLLIAGMVTSVAVSLLGLVLMLFSAIGWFRSVLPVEAHEFVEAEAEPTTIPSLRTSIERLPIGPMHRKVIPVETFQFTTGLRGGVAGGIAMIVPATAFSLLRYHSLWYATNLMAAGGFVGWANQSDAFLAQFHWQACWQRSAFTSPRLCSSACSMAPCCPCFLVGPSLQRASSRRCCGPACSLRCSASSAPF